MSRQTPDGEPTFEDVLADPMWQSGYDHELLPMLLRVEMCRCAAVHVGRCTSGDTHRAVSAPASDDASRQTPDTP